VQILGSGFVSRRTGRLDALRYRAATWSVDPSGRLITTTIPKVVPGLASPLRVDVISVASQSNASSYRVKAVDMSVACTGGPATPSSVAIADQLAQRHLLAASCREPTAAATTSRRLTLTWRVLRLAPCSTQLRWAPPRRNCCQPRLVWPWWPTMAAITCLSSISSPNTQTRRRRSRGTNPIGVAIDDASGVAMVANFASNTVRRSTSASCLVASRGDIAHGGDYRRVHSLSPWRSILTAAQ